MHAKRKSASTPLTSVPQEQEEDAISSLSESTWKSAPSSHKSRYSTASSNSSINNNESRPTTSASRATHRRHHSPSCHRHSHGQHSCHCIQNFYEDDEVCRKNRYGRLEFGIV